MDLKSALLTEIYNSLVANTTDDKILNFADVSMGWHFGEGTSISAAAIRDASKLHETFLLNGLYETDAFPGLAGEIRVTAYQGNKYYEFTRETDGGWSYVYELDGEVETELYDLTLEQVQNIVKNCSNDIWNISAICQGGIGTPIWEDFKALPFAHQATEEFPLWTSLVLPPSGQFVNTSEHFIPLLGSLPSSGHSITPYYQTPHQSLCHPATQMTHATETSWDFPAISQKAYSRNFASNPTMSRPASEIIRRDSSLQILLPLEAVA